MPELAMFAYPWDAAADGPESMVAELADLGVDRLEIATAYHSAETIRPRRSNDVHVVIEPNVAHLPLDTSRFAELAPREGRLAREQAELYPRLAKAARDKGIKLTGWTITLHQSDLAERFPQHALENCFGDRSGHGLCPADPAVADYAVELCAAVAGTGHFDELMVESLSYSLAGHGHPHALWAARLDTASRLLLSLCFCPSCLAEGSSRGIDGTALRRWVGEQLSRTWNSSLAGSRTPDDGAEVAAMLVRSPELAAWLRMRCEVVTALCGRVVERAREAGVAVVSGSAVWIRPSALNWMEGIDLAALSKLCAGVALMPYHPDAADVARDLDVATGLGAPEKFQLLQTIFPTHHARAEALLGKIELGLAAGLERFGLYNLAMAPRPVLGWVRQVADRLHATPPTDLR